MSLAAASNALAEDLPAPPGTHYLRVVDARIQNQGTLSFTTLGGLSYADNLFNDGATDTLVAARLKAFASAFDFLQVGLALGTRANDHSTRLPPVSQTVGDPSALLRGGYRFFPWLSLAGEFELALPTASRDIGVEFGAISPKLTTAVGLHAPFGLTGTLNLGAAWDRTETAFREPLTDVLRYSAHVSNTPWVYLGGAVDYRYAPFAFMSLTPFLETSFQLPVGSVDTAQGMAGLIGAGLRVALGSNDALAVTIGGEYAYLRPDPTRVAVPAVAPWAVDIGLAYAFNLFAEPVAAASPPPPPKEVIKEVVKEVAPPTGRIKGVVIDRETRTPIVDATVEIAGAEMSALVVNGSDGTFATYALPANKPYKLKVVATGYTAGEVNAVVGADGVRTIEVALDRAGAAQFGELRGIIKAAADGKPLAASIVVTGIKERFASDPATGAFVFKLPVGDHNIAVGAPGYRTQKKKIRIRPGDVVILNVDLAQ
ncbi:MAG: carboxypeptidase regulatory-like domain-containing protein [Deltaproteobacteria bacterium]|nr:carboxypeptidase regulatory-like domain-containing protein [Deltaproteobacteria bacterium]